MSTRAKLVTLSLLIIVAVGVWLINCLPLLPTLPFNLLAWILNVAVVFIPMVIGGAISLLLVKAPNQIESQVNELDNKINSQNEQKQ